MPTINYVVQITPHHPRPSPTTAPAMSYRLFGDFWLAEPSAHLNPTKLDELRGLEPYLRQFDIPTQELPLHTSSNFDIEQEFASFRQTESNLWQPPRPQSELVRPSGTLDWPIAHHLHNPSFTTMDPHDGETMDESNPCVWLVMANSFVPGKTFIFDHLSRREASDGLKEYPKSILECHEQWLAKLRKFSVARVEIVYG